MNVKHIGVLAVLFASIMWAIEPVFAKLAYQQNSDFLQLSLIRAIFVTLTAFTYILLTKNIKLRINKEKISRKGFLGVIITLIGVFILFL